MAGKRQRDSRQTGPGDAVKRDGSGFSLCLPSAQRPGKRTGLQGVPRATMPRLAQTTKRPSFRDAVRCPAIASGEGNNQRRRHGARPVSAATPAARPSRLLALLPLFLLVQIVLTFSATSINKVTQVSSVRFNDASSVCCRVWSPPKATSPALAVYSARLTLPSPSPCPSGNRHTGVSPCLQVLFVCLACLLLAVLDPTRERSHTVLVCLRLADFTQHERLGIHPCCSTWQYLTFFMAE